MQIYVPINMQAVVIYNLSYFSWNNDKNVKVRVKVDPNPGRWGKVENNINRKNNNNNNNNNNNGQKGFHVYPNLRLQQVMPISRKTMDDKKDDDEGEDDEATTQTNRPEGGESSKANKARRIIDNMKTFGSKTIDKVRLVNVNVRGMSRNVRNRARTSFAKLAWLNEKRSYEKMPSTDDQDADMGFFDTDNDFVASTSTSTIPSDMCLPSTSASAMTSTSVTPESTSEEDQIIIVEKTEEEGGPRRERGFKMIQSSARRSFRKVLKIKNLLG